MVNVAEFFFILEIRRRAIILNALLSLCVCLCARCLEMRAACVLFQLNIMNVIFL